jgi:hypothetical protein
MLMSMRAGNTCERHCGRLLEIRMEAGYQHVEEAAELLAAIQFHAAQLPASERLARV